MTGSKDEFRLRVTEAQLAFCRARGAEYTPAAPELKLGLAVSTTGRTPVNGLRHPPSAHTTGWYIWFGEQFSEAADFFQPVHTLHIYEEYPELIKILGLPVGYRFLLADDYLDVWYDASLLRT